MLASGQAAMRVLGIDTASPRPELALVEASDAPGAREAVAALPPAAAEALPEALSSLLSSNGLRVSHLARVAVLSGPGSFTGLRAGIAFARGLARALGVPLVTVPTFEAARAALDPGQGPVDLFLGAGRGEVYRCRARPDADARAFDRLPRHDAAAEAAEAGVPTIDLAEVRLALASAAARLAAGGASGGDEGPAYGRRSAAEERFGT